jgi:hypothetical protein
MDTFVVVAGFFSNGIGLLMARNYQDLSLFNP